MSRFFNLEIMSVFNQFKNAISGYGKSFKFINENKLWGWFVVPGIINLIIFVVLGIFAWNYSEDLSDYFIQVFGVEDETSSSIIFWTTLIISRLSITLVFVLIYRYLLLIMVSPALALFADKIYKIQTGNELPFNLKIFINNVFRGIGLAIKNLINEIVLTILVSLFSFTGVLAPAVPIVIFIIQGYFYGFSMIDYRCELQGMNIKQSSVYVWNNKGVAIGNGVVFNLVLLIPFVGVLIGPMLSLVASFLSFEDKEEIIE